MKKMLKTSLLFALCMIPFAAVGGWFTGSYAFASYTPKVQEEIQAQMGSVQALCLAAAVQSVMLVFMCTLIGSIFAQKTGLLRTFLPEKSTVGISLAVTLACGIFFAADYWTFGKKLPQVAELYESGLLTRRTDNWLSSIFYGGMAEEILLRLFFMSLLAFLIWKLFFRSRGREEIPAGVFAAANIISALAFAAGHIPATLSMFGGLEPLVVIRCFVLNGGLGLVFGWLYRRYGIAYAMLGHAGAHIVSKLIWLIFI